MTLVVNGVLIVVFAVVCMIVDVVVVVVVGVAIDVVVGVGIFVAGATVVEDGELGVLGVGVGDEEETAVVVGGATTWFAVGLLDMKIVYCCCELFVSCCLLVAFRFGFG